MMTREEIIRLAKESFGVEFISESDGGKLERFAELVAAAEREACAVVCEKSDRYRGDYFAAKIRAMGSES